MKCIPKMVWVAVLVTSALAGSGVCRETSPKYWVNDLCTRYWVSGKTLGRYSSDGRQINDGNADPVFTCPRDFRILDYDVGESGGKAVAGILMARADLIYVEILDIATGAVMAGKNMTAYQPWKIRFADADNDSNTEVCMGVYKRSPLHPVLAKRLFIYTFQHGIQPKWLGSRLSRPFTDFGFAVREKTTILYAVETGAARTCFLNAYVWDSFGFTGSGRVENASADKISLWEGYAGGGGTFRKTLFVVNRDKTSVTEVP